MKRAGSQMSEENNLAVCEEYTTTTVDTEYVVNMKYHHNIAVEQNSYPSDNDSNNLS